MILDFFKQNQVCRHDKVPIDVEEAYCPDCGELVKNSWFLVRCSCCNIKRHAHSEYNEIKPNTKYCPNCGCTDYYVEEIEKINFVDIHYAVYKKIVVPQKGYTSRQVWVEEDNKLLESKKLIGGFSRE